MCETGEVYHLAMRTLFVIAALVAAALAAAACGGGDAARALPTAPSGLAVIPLHYDGGTLDVEVADRGDSRAVGLGNRDALASDAGMLFVFNSPLIPGFWMKDMRFPLDMVWIDADKKILGIARDVQPQPGDPPSKLRFYRPESPIIYVLEINAGASARLGLQPGDSLDFDLPTPSGSAPD